MGNCICCPCWSKEKANAVETPHLSKRGGSCELRLRNKGRKKGLKDPEGAKLRREAAALQQGGTVALWTVAPMDGGLYGRNGGGGGLRWKID